MNFNDLFAGDPFSALALTQRINSLPFTDGQIRSRLPWNVTNAITDKIAVQKSSQGIGIISSAERGAPGQEFGRAKKNLVSLTAPHYPVGATIQSTELKAALANVDQANQFMAVQTLHDGYQAAFVRAFTQAWEFGAQGALEALIKDPNGDTILDLGDIYGEVPQEREVDWTSPDVDLVTEFEESKSAALKELGGLPAVLDWILIMVGPSSKLIRSNKKLADTKQRIDPAWLAADRVRNSSQYRFSDNVELVTYQGTANAPTAFDYVAEEGAAYLCPVVDGMYDVTFTPAESFEAINGPGQEMYSSVPKSKVTESSYRLEAESNFVHTIKKPKGIIKWVLPH